MESFFVDDSVALKEDPSIRGVIEVCRSLLATSRLSLTFGSKPGVMYASHLASASQA
jgi:hypothetical protein